MLGLAYGLSSRDYGQSTIDTLEVQLSQATARAEAAKASLLETEAVAEEMTLQLAQLQAGGGSAASAPAIGVEEGHGLGRIALDEEIAAWDIDVRPDGLGLPAGSGDVWTGEEVFVEKCASCHGDFGEAVGRWPVLAGGLNTIGGEDPVKTIGSYWPYLSTVYDYVNRAMPFGEAQSLEPDEIYAITAYLLYLNDIVDDDFELSDANFAEVVLPNQDNFYLDDRAEIELPVFAGDVCMSDCKDTVEITMRAAVLDVTPEGDDEDGGAMEEEAHDNGSDATEEAAAGEATQDIGEPAVDPALIAAGEGLFRQCKACHQIGEGAVNRTGPHLNGLLGRAIGGIDGFRYSRSFADAAANGDVWGAENLTAFLADPRGAMSGTKMAFRGVSDPAEIAALIAYLEDAGG